MKRISVILPTSLILLLSPLSCWEGPSHRAAMAAPPATDNRKSEPPMVGGQATDFELENLEGKKIKLSALLEKGKVVVVVLRGYPGYQCPLCLKQFGQFIKRADDLEAGGATIVMIYPGVADGLKDHARDFTMGTKLPAQGFHFVTDPDFQLTKSWNLRWDEPNETVYPSTFVIGKDRSILYSKVSKSHGGRSSVDDVLKALK